MIINRGNKLINTKIRYLGVSIAANSCLFLPVQRYGELLLLLILKNGINLKLSKYIPLTSYND